MINLQNLAFPTAIVISSAWVIVGGNISAGFSLFVLGILAHAGLRGIECAIQSHLIEKRSHYH